MSYRFIKPFSKAPNDKKTNNKSSNRQAAQIQRINNQLFFSSINKIPFLRSTKIQTLAGVNFLYTAEKKEYTEFFIGFEHIFKMIRFDFVSKYYKGEKLIPEFKIGVGF